MARTPRKVIDCAGGFSWSYSRCSKKLRDPQEREQTTAAPGIGTSRTLRETSVRAALGSASLSTVVLGGTERVAETFVRSYLCLPHYKEHSKLS